MKKLQILGVALIAVFAFGAMTVASASGAITTLLAEWLVGGVGIATGAELLVESEGELLLIDEKAKVGIITVKASVLCSGILDGFIGANGADLITEVLTLTGTGVSQTGLVEPGLTCLNVENCEEPLAWAVNLPWNTLLELAVDGTEEPFAVLIKSSTGNVGWLVSCMKGPTGEIEDECITATGVFQASNEVGGVVDATFSKSFTELMELPLAHCSLSGENSGVVEGLGLIKPDTTEALTVSE